MRKMKHKFNLVRLLILVVVLLVWYSNAKAQCYQNEDIQGEAATIYERFCTGYWLHGVIEGYRATIYYKAREDQFKLCGLSDETHDLCTVIYNAEISENKEMLIVSGEPMTYDKYKVFHFKEFRDYIHVKAFDENNKLIFESKNFEWYSY